MDTVLRALAAPRRREILHLIAHDSLTVGEIAGRMSISRPAVSQHLAVLDGAGLVALERVGRQTICRALPSALSELRDYINDFWRSALDDLRIEAEAEAEQRRKNAIHAITDPDTESDHDDL